MFIVYELWNPVDQSCFYVGKGNTTRARLPDHIRQARYLMEGRKPADNNMIKAGIIRSILEQGMEPEFKIVFRSENEQDVLGKEIELIAQYGRRNLGTGCLANMTDGGEGVIGWKYSDEAKARRSRASKGRKMSEEAKDKIRQAAFQRKHSEETRKKISEVQKGRKQSTETIEKRRIAQVGKIMSEEAKAKIRAAKLGVKLSPEHAEKCRRARVGKTDNEETKIKKITSPKSKMGTC